MVLGGGCGGLHGRENRHMEVIVWNEQRSSAHGRRMDARMVRIGRALMAHQHGVAASNDAPGAAL